MTPPPTQTVITALTPADPTKVSFADIPAELRNMIYYWIGERFRYSVTYNGPYGVGRVPLLGVHPLISHEFISLFFSTPRTYEFTELEVNGNEGKATAFFESLAFRNIIQTKRSRIELSRKGPPYAPLKRGDMLSNRRLVEFAKMVTAIAYKHMKKEYARLRAGGSLKGEDAVNARRWFSQELYDLCTHHRSQNSFFSIVGRLLCMGLPKLVSGLPLDSKELYVVLEVVFKETEFHGFSLRGTSGPEERID